MASARARSADAQMRSATSPISSRSPVVQARDRRATGAEGADAVASLPHDHAGNGPDLRSRQLSPFRVGEAQVPGDVLDGYRQPSVTGLEQERCDGRDRPATLERRHALRIPGLQDEFVRDDGGVADAVDAEVLAEHRARRGLHRDRIGNGAQAIAQREQERRPRGRGFCPACRGSLRSGWR